MRKFTLTLLTGAAAIAAATPALAQDRQAPKQDLTRAAVQERAAQAFQRLDANDDGKIDAADREARRKEMFARVDANGDGGISYEEFTAMRGQRGERPDGARAGRSERGGPDGARWSRGGGKRGGAMAMRGMARNADADKDGAITQAEFTTAMLARFDAADADKNGTVTAEERKAQRDSMRDRMRERRNQRIG